MLLCECNKNMVKLDVTVIKQIPWMNFPWNGTWMIGERNCPWNCNNFFDVNNFDLLKDVILLDMMEKSNSNSCFFSYLGSIWIYFWNYSFKSKVSFSLKGIYISTFLWTIFLVQITGKLLTTFEKKSYERKTSLELFKKSFFFSKES